MRADGGGAETSKYPPVIAPAVMNNKSSSSPKTMRGSSSSTTAIVPVTGVGIGPSGARLPPLEPSQYADFAAGMNVGVGNARFFNIYEFLAKDDKEPKRKFYPIERVAPFWSLMGLDVYVERWQWSDGDSGNATPGGGIAGSLAAGFSSLTGGGVGAGGEAGGGGGGDPAASTMTVGGGASSKEAPVAFTVAPLYEQLAKALSFQCHILQESERSMYAGTGGIKSSHPLENGRMVGGDIIHRIHGRQALLR